MIQSLRRRAGVTAALCGLALALAACGSDDEPGTDPSAAGDGGYPHRSVTFIVPYAPGGGTDTISRVFAEYLGKELGVPVAVKNVEGASGAIGGTELFESEPDGSVIGMQADGVVLNPLVNTSLPYKGFDDFDLITEMATVPQVMVTGAKQPYNNLADVVAAAKQHPGELGIATSGKGTTSDIAGIIFGQAGGVEFNRIPQQSGSESRTSVIAGRVEFTIASPGTYLGNIEAGELKPLGVFAAERLPELPDTPTAIEQGFQAEVSSNYHVLAPKGLPAGVRDALVAASARVAENPEYQKKVRNLGSVPTGLSPDEMRTKFQRTTDQMRGIIPVLNS